MNLEQRKRLAISLIKNCGMTHLKIADASGLSNSTIEKMAVGSYAVTEEQIEILNDLVKRGPVFPQAMPQSDLQRFWHHTLHEKCVSMSPEQLEALVNFIPYVFANFRKDAIK